MHRTALKRRRTLETSRGMSKIHFRRCNIEDVRIVREYPDVFPEELPGMPPHRDIEFIIDLIPGAGPIAKRPYKMDVDELKELKKQLKEQLDKGFIQRSSSPWGVMAFNSATAPELDGVVTCVKTIWLGRDSKCRYLSSYPSLENLQTK